MHTSKSIKQITILILCLSSLLAYGDIQPNVIIIFNDDQGYQDLGCYGSPDIKTPRVDQMAKEGMKFTDFYVASSVCSPSRAALLTGCYPQRVGVGGVFFPNKGNNGLNPAHVTIAETLKTVGYKTKAVGKWHLGDDVKFLPTNQGFDSYYGIPYSNDMSPSRISKYAEDCLWREGMSEEILQKAFAALKTDKKALKNFNNKVPLMQNQEVIEFPADQSTITKRFASESITFISESVKEKNPFFLYLANSMPHTPLFASPDFKGKSQRGLYGDVIEEIDYNVGRILDHLDELGIADDTIVIFSSDNGPWLIKGKNGGSALPLFEGKMTNFEGGQRVPAIVRWPNKIPAGSICNEIATSMDLYPTIAQIAGANLPEMALDGQNILDLLMGVKDAVSPHKYFFYGQRAVRSGDWKYHKVEKFVTKKTQRDTNSPSLYNLKEDIGESKNIIDKYPEIANRLKKALELLNPNRPQGRKVKK
ncbi:MAG: sulfatase [Planctomycetes bacterium]|nr:sulfatase [Planctomycetota bacterium]